MTLRTFILISLFVAAVIGYFSLLMFQRSEERVFYGDLRPVLIGAVMLLAGSRVAVTLCTPRNDVTTTSIRRPRRLNTRR